MTLTLALFEPTVEWETAQARYETDLAWDEWRKASCVERHGAHDWHAELPSVDDGTLIQLFCPHCPANVGDLLWVDTDLVFGEVDGIPVENGKSRSLDYYTAPVTVRLVDEGHYSWEYGGYEPDPWIEVLSRAA